MTVEPREIAALLRDLPSLRDGFESDEAREAWLEHLLARIEAVRQQGQTRNHVCHWPGCERQVPPAMWGCKPHWFKLPKALRDRVWDAYVPGQERRLDPSDEYLAVAHEVQAWIEAHGG